jgi:peptidoglycan hydrolase-like protein with peptidoglycan-binding domain
MNMKKTPMLRFVSLILAGLTVVAAGVSLSIARAGQPVTVEAAPVVPTTGPPTTHRTTTTAPPTSTTTTTTAPPAPTTTTTTREAEPASLRRGDDGADVRRLQQRLQRLGYWLGQSEGAYGLLTEQAVMAFQKVEGLTPDGVAGPATQAALAEAGRPTTRASGDLIEVDKARQVLFVVRDGSVAWVLNTSTGTERPYQVGGRTELADTPPGRWKVTWVVDGVDVGELGALYRPRYFHGDGIAVHGYHSVPAYPASHGCVRVTEAAMDWIWAAGLMPMGSTVWVH